MYMFIGMMLGLVSLSFTAIASADLRNWGFLKAKLIRSNHSKRMAHVNEDVVSKRLVTLYHPTNKHPYGEGRVPGQLKEIGCRLRIWRIQTGVSRAALAKELGIEPERLLFLEMGDALPEDFTKEQLTELLAKVTQSVRRQRVP